MVCLSIPSFSCLFYKTRTKNISVHYGFFNNCSKCIAIVGKFGNCSENPTDWLTVNWDLFVLSLVLFVSFLFFPCSHWSCLESKVHWHIIFAWWLACFDVLQMHMVFSEGEYLALELLCLMSHHSMSDKWFFGRPKRTHTQTKCFWCRFKRRKVDQKLCQTALFWHTAMWARHKWNLPALWPPTPPPSKFTSPSSP